MDIDKHSDNSSLNYYGLKDLTDEMKDGFNEENINSLIEKLKEKPEFNIRKANKEYLTNLESQEYLRKNASEITIGANLHDNEYGHSLFADYFFFITGFHGFHVFSGVVILIVILMGIQ